MKSGTSLLVGLAVIFSLVHVTLVQGKSSNHPPRPPTAQYHFPQFPYPKPPVYPPYPPRPQPPTYTPYPARPQPPTYPPYPPHPQPPTYPPYPPHPQPPTYPPHPGKPCNLCTEIEKELSDTLDSLKWIHDKVTPSSDCQSAIKFLSGPETSSDASPSDVSCPEDFVAIDCRCSIENNICDGTEVTGRTCSATRSNAAGPSIKAQVTCVPSCSGTYTLETVPDDGTFDPTPTATCDPGTQIIGCWALDNNNAAFVGTSIDEATNSCTTASGCGAGGCRIQAICKAN